MQRRRGARLRPRLVHRRAEKGLQLATEVIEPDVALKGSRVGVARLELRPREPPEVVAL